MAYGLLEQVYRSEAVQCCCQDGWEGRRIGSVSGFPLTHLSNCVGPRQWTVAVSIVERVGGSIVLC